MILKSPEKNQKLQYDTWKNQEKIMLNHPQIDDRTLDILAQSGLPNLQQLWIGFCSNFDQESIKITGRGIEKFIKNKFPKLRFLYIQGKNIQIQIIKLLQNGLKTIWIYSIKKISFKSILQHQIAIPKKLRLSHMKLGIDSIKLLIKADMSQVRQFSISDCFIGYEGVKHCTKANFFSLQNLVLGDDEQYLYDQVLYHSIDCPELRYIYTINFGMSDLMFLANNFKPLYNIKAFQPNSQIQNKCRNIYLQSMAQ